MSDYPSAGVPAPLTGAEDAPPAPSVAEHEPSPEALCRLREELRKLSIPDPPPAPWSIVRTGGAPAEPSSLTEPAQWDEGPLERSPGDTAEPTHAGPLERSSGDTAKPTHEGPEPASAAEPASGFDLPPELIAYTDRGCHVAPHCLHCPLPACIYDRQPSQRSRRRQARDRRLRKLAERGWSTAQLAWHFDLSASQVRRIRLVGR